MKKIIIVLAGLIISAVSPAQVSLVKPNVYAYDGMTALNGKILFFATDDAAPYNYELWVTDGTEAGTNQLTDINGTGEGSILSNSYWGPNYGDRMPVVYNNEMYFLATDNTHGMEIWKTDGTAAGTEMLKDIHPGASGFFDPEFNYPYFTEMGGMLYFAANDGSHGFELWKTDGTDGGTQMVKDISADGIYGSNPEHLINFNGKLYFTARDDVYGYELYTSDGTAAGTEIVKDIVPGIGGSMNDGFAGSIDPQFTVSGDYLYFTARKDESLPVTFNLFRTDGTDAGTIALNNTLQNVTNFCDVNGTCYFYAFDGDFDHSGLWKSDGTLAGTILIDAPDGINANSIASSFYNFNDRLYFSGFSYTTSEFGLALCDGTAAGTDILYGFEAVASIPEVHNFNADGTNPWFFYLALKKISDMAMSVRMVQSNGTAAGNIVYPGVQPFRSSAFIGDDIYFAGIDSTADEVWGIYKIHPTALIENIQSANSDKALTISPNPGQGLFEVCLPEGMEIGSLTVSNLNGAIIYRKQLITKNNKVQIDLGSQPAGIYVVQITDGKMSYNQKVSLIH